MCSTTTRNNQSESKSAAKFKKRAGAKAVKTFERNAAGADGVLNRQAATTYRAVSPRANYLAADRADGAYSSKELCRDFAIPNDNSLSKLKRLGRYYVGRPRLVYIDMISATYPLPSSTLIAKLISQDVR